MPLIKYLICVPYSHTDHELPCGQLVMHIHQTCPQNHFPFQPLHQYEQNQRIVKGHRGQDHRPAQSWNGLQDQQVAWWEGDDYCCNYSEEWKNEKWERWWINPKGQLGSHQGQSPRTAPPTHPNPQDGTCRHLSLVLQGISEWFGEDLEESGVVRWNKVQALWYQLNPPYLEEE